MVRVKKTLYKCIVRDPMSNDVLLDTTEDELKKLLPQINETLRLKAPTMFKFLTLRKNKQQAVSRHMLTAMLHEKHSTSCGNIPKQFISIVPSPCQAS